MTRRDAQTGKGGRVLGVFLILFGGGLALESSTPWLGGALLMVGTCLLLWGLRTMRDTSGRNAGLGG